jgi:hypothetical protein
MDAFYLDRETHSLTSCIPNRDLIEENCLLIYAEQNVRSPVQSVNLKWPGRRAAAERIGLGLFCQILTKSITR